MVVNDKQTQKDKGLNIICTNENLNRLDNRKNIDNFTPIIVWKNVLIFSLLHVGALYGIYCCYFAKRETLIFCKSYNLFFIKQ